MGSYTFANFKDYLKINLGNRDGLTTYLPVWVNAGYIGLCSINKFPVGRQMVNINFPELDTNSDATTIDGQPHINRPSRCLHVHTLWDMTNDKQLKRKNWDWYVNQTDRTDTGAEDVPSYWVVYGNKIYLHPTPAGAYNVRIYHRKPPTRFVNDEDVSAIGEEWDDAILALASVKACMGLRDFSTADIWRKEFMNTVASMVGMPDKETMDTKEVFRPDPGYLDFSYKR